MTDAADSPLRKAARRFGDKPALIDGVGEWTFSELDGWIDRVAGAFRERLPLQSRVALYLHNCAEFVVAQLALERAGMVRVPINHRLSEREIAKLFTDSGVGLVLCDEHTLPAAEAALLRARIDAEPLVVPGPAWSDLCDARPILRDESGVDLDRYCSINYTSGSSGDPKGVSLTFRQWRAVYKNMLIDRRIASDDVVAHIGPFTHAAGTYLMPCLLRGATNVVVEGGKVDNLLLEIEKRRVTGFTCVPTVLTRIVSHPRLEQLDLRSLRWIGYGAEPVPANTVRKAIDRFGPILIQNYGLTEAMMTCALLGPDEHLDADGAVRLGVIGRPYTFVDIVLRGVDGEPVPDGEVGEVTIRAEHVMQGYWNNPQATAAALRDGWLWTGDLARKAPDGLLYLAGRSKEMIISGGFNIYPGEVESYISTHPQVHECAVIGVEDAEFGEALVAFVAGQGREVPDIHLLKEFARQGLGLKAPRRWAALAELPRTANGKIDKKGLRAAFEESRLVG